MQASDAPSLSTRSKSVSGQDTQDTQVKDSEVRQKQDETGKMMKNGKSIFEDESCSEGEGKGETTMGPPEVTQEKCNAQTDTAVQNQSNSAEVGMEADGSDMSSNTTYCKGGPGQMVCGNPVKDGQSGVECDKCGMWFHSACQLVPSAAVTALKKIAVLTWFCTECKASLTKQPKLNKKITQLESKVADLDVSLREHMKLTHGSLKEIEVMVAEQSILTKKSYKELEKTKASYASMVRDSCAEAVTSIQKSVPSNLTQKTAGASSQAAQEISGVIDNFIDKERRKLNVVIYNLPEQGLETDTVTDKMQKDIALFCQIMREELHLNVRVSRAFRAGQKVPNRPRLLIVTLDSTEVKMELLKLSSELKNSENWHSLYINPDLTRKEREDGKKLRQELAARKSAGESNIYIRQGKIIQGGTQGQGRLNPRQVNPSTKTTAAVPSASGPIEPSDVASSNRSEKLKEG